MMSMNQSSTGTGSVRGSPAKAEQDFDEEASLMEPDEESRVKALFPWLRSYKLRRQAGIMAAVVLFAGAAAVLAVDYFGEFLAW